MVSVPGRRQHGSGADEELTSVHRAEHGGDEAVDTVRLLDLRHERRDAAFVIGRTSKVGKDEFLERVDLVLKVHEVRDGLVAEHYVRTCTLKLDAHPSFGSSTPRNEMYSSYSNRPLKSGCRRWNLSLARMSVT